MAIERERHAKNTPRVAKIPKIVYERSNLCVDEPLIFIVQHTHTTHFVPIFLFFFICRLKKADRLLTLSFCGRGENVLSNITRL